MTTAKPNRFGAAVTKRTAPTPTPGSVGEQQRKYTVLLTHSIATDFDEDVLALYRTAGRKIDKSEALRVLLGLLHTDPQLAGDVAHQLARDGMTA